MFEEVSYPLQIKSIDYKETDKSYEKTPGRFAFYKWYCVLYGSVEMIVDGREIVIQPEESLLIPPNAERCSRALKTMVGYICLYFENQNLELGQLENRVVSLSESLIEDVRALTGELKSPGCSDSLHYIYALVIRLLISQLRSVAEGKESKHHDSFLNHEYKKDLIQKIDHFIFSHIKEPLSREQLAESFHFSPSHLARLYKGMTGKTLTDKVIKTRMERARSLLLGSTINITLIAEEVGYNSYSHFSQVFKKETGITPSIYRKTHGTAYGTRQISGE